MNRSLSICCKLAKKPVIVVISLLMATAVVWAKGPPLPEPDPERGGIAVTVRGRAPAGNKSPAVQVYFVRLGDDVDMLAAETVIPSNFSKKKQVYLLNAKPGRYVAVSAQLRDLGINSGTYKVFFEAELIPQTEIEVIPGQITFMGDFLVDLKMKMSESDEAQAHYNRLIDPSAARKGFMGRAFSGSYTYRGELVSVERSAEAEAEYWTVARDKVFKKDATWRTQVEKQLASMGNRTVPGAESPGAESPGTESPGAESPGAESLIERVSLLVERTEAAEGTEDQAREQFQRDMAAAFGRTEDESTHEINQLLKELESYLENNPEDVEAVLSSVRLSRIQWMEQPVVIGGPDAEEQLAQLEAKDHKWLAKQQELLDGALQVEPANAMVYYWKARLYGLRPTWLGKEWNVEEAIRYGRRAVNLDPENVGYREVLAQYLIYGQRDEEAMEPMRSVADGCHPIYLLINDMNVIPIPQSAIFMPDESRGLAASMASKGRFTNFPELRARIYAVPMSAKDIEAYYHQHWPDFRLIKDSQEKGQGFTVRSYMQALRWRSGHLKTVANKKKDFKREDEIEGFILFVMEFIGLRADLREQSPLARVLPNDAEVFASIAIANLRTRDFNVCD